MLPRPNNKPMLALAAALLGAAAVGAQPPRPSAQPATAASASWTAAPLTPGRWAYNGGALSSANYGGLFTIRCLGGGRIALERSGAVTGIGLTLRTTAMERVVTGRRGTAAMTAELPAGDPLLDALAFSRGRFAVEAAGQPRLIVPAWPELARVVEDCRRGQ
jgi:hypothetical protein